MTRTRWRFCWLHATGRKTCLNFPYTRDGKFGQNGLFFYDSVQVVYNFNHISKLNNNAQISFYSDLLPALTPAKADEPSFAWMKVPDVILEKEMNGNLIEIHDNSVPSTAMSYAVTPQMTHWVRIQRTRPTI